MYNVVGSESGRVNWWSGNETRPHPPRVEIETRSTMVPKINVWRKAKGQIWSRSDEIEGASVSITQGENGSLWTSRCDHGCARCPGGKIWWAYSREECRTASNGVCTTCMSGPRSTYILTVSERHWLDSKYARHYTRVQNVDCKSIHMRQCNGLFQIVSVHPYRGRDLHFLP